MKVLNIFSYHVVFNRPPPLHIENTNRRLTKTKKNSYFQYSTLCGIYWIQLYPVLFYSVVF